jgi:hypothetical protein
VPLRVDLKTGEIINRADPIHVFRCVGVGGCLRAYACVIVLLFTGAPLPACCTWLPAMVVVPLFCLCWWRQCCFDPPWAMDAAG